MINNIPDAINKIQWADEVCEDNPEFEIIIKQDGKIVYHNKAFAGVVNLVQSVKFDSDKVTVEGDNQAFGFGHPYVQIFALDQLQKKLVPNLIKIISNLRREADGKNRKDKGR